MTPDAATLAFLEALKIEPRDVVLAESLFSKELSS
jgi:hypothetical protein